MQFNTFHLTQTCYNELSFKRKDKGQLQIVTTDWTPLGCTVQVTIGVYGF